MILLDVNVLVYAFREESPHHPLFKRWLADQVNSDASFGLSELAASGFLRIVTNPKVFDPPTAIAYALEFVETLLEQPNCVAVRPGPRHWTILSNLCRKVQAKGNLIPDAYLAALAIETGSEWITTDRDFARFPGLKWRHPMEH